MNLLESAEFGRISVVFEDSTDGGLRVYSDDVPGFMLSHSDANAVKSDVEPALKTIITAMVGAPMTVVFVTSREAPSFVPERREVREYEARRAA
jgi:hypothetical protein